MIRFTFIATLFAAPFLAYSANALGTWFQTYSELGDKVLLKDPKQAEKYYDLAESKLSSSNSPTYDRAHLDFSRAKAALNLCDKKKAVELIRKSLQENPKGTETGSCSEERKLLALVLFETDHYDEAEKIAHEAWSSDKKNGVWNNPQPIFVEALCNLQHGNESRYQELALKAFSRCMNARFDCKLFNNCPPQCSFIAIHDFNALAQFLIMHRENQAALPLLVWAQKSSNLDSADFTAMNKAMLSRCLALVGREKESDRLSPSGLEYLKRNEEGDWLQYELEPKMQQDYLSSCEKTFGKWSSRSQDARCDIITTRKFDPDEKKIADTIGNFIAEAEKEEKTTADKNKIMEYLAQFYLWKSQIDLQKKKSDDALRELEHALELHKQLGSAGQKQSIFELTCVLSMLAECYVQNQQPDKAEAIFQQAINLWNHIGDKTPLRLVLDKYMKVVTSQRGVDEGNKVWLETRLPYPADNYLEYSSAEVMF